MAEREPSSRASRTRQHTERDLARLHKAENGGHFWRALAVVGSVGWPIVGLSLGGVLLGRFLDGWSGSGHRWTLTLLVLGTLAGCVAAYRTLRGGGQ